MGRDKKYLNIGVYPRTLYRARKGDGFTERMDHWVKI